MPMPPIVDLMIIGLVVIALSGLRVAQEYERGVVFRLGRYRGLRGPALYRIIPLGIERAVKVDIRTRTVSADKINTLLGDNISASTEAWGLEVQRFEMKDVELPQAMRQVMAMQAEAIREKRARIIKAEAELEASVKLSAAAAQITANPAALELRRMQMISEVGVKMRNAADLDRSIKFRVQLSQRRIRCS